MNTSSTSNNNNINSNVVGKTLSSSLEQLNINNNSDNSQQPPKPKNKNYNNNNRNNNNRNNNNQQHPQQHNTHNRNNNKQRYHNNRNQNNQPYNEENDPELLLAFEMSKVAYELEQEQKQKLDSSNDFSIPLSASSASFVPSSSSTTTTTTTTTTTNNNNNNNNSNNNYNNIKFDASRIKKKDKVDMTHLLKFKSTLPQRGAGGTQQSSSSSSNVNTNSYRPPRHNNNNNSNHHSSNNNNYNYNHNNHKKKQHYNGLGHGQKDSTFLQANYLFKINPFGNYTSALSESDSLVAWNKVEQVVYLINLEEYEKTTCCICLEKPIAPKMTKCGHILCYSCILRSLSHTNKCPLCLLAIESKHDLKSLVFKITKKYNTIDEDSTTTTTTTTTSTTTGSEIDFTLIKYQNGSTVPFLSSQSIPIKISFPNQGDENEMFSRFSIVNSIDEIIDVEMNQILLFRETALKDCELETMSFLSDAMMDIQTRQETYKKMFESRQLQNEKNYITIISTKPTATKNYNHYTYSNNFEIRLALEDYFNSSEFNDSNTPSNNSDDDNELVSEQQQDQTTTTTTTTTTEPPQQPPPTSTTDTRSFSYENQPSDQIYYLYQSSDGQKIYIHPLNMKMLDYEKKGDPEKLKSILKGCRVLEFEHVTVTNETRKQYKSLSVLPTTTSITFAEIDLSSTLSKETLNQFSAELKQRRDNRNQKKRKEQKAQRTKEIERAKDIERANELRELERVERIKQQEAEKKRIEQDKLDYEEGIRNGTIKLNKKLGFLEAIQSHKNIDSLNSFPSLLNNNSNNNNNNKKN